MVSPEKLALAASLILNTGGNMIKTADKIIEADEKYLEEVQDEREGIDRVKSEKTKIDFLINFRLCKSVKTVKYLVNWI